MKPYLRCFADCEQCIGIGAQLTIGLVLGTLLANDTRSAIICQSTARGTPTLSRMGLPSRRRVGGGLAPGLVFLFSLQRLTLQVSLLWHRLRRQGGGGRRGRKPPRLPCPAPRQGACKAPWNPLLNRYLLTLK